MRKTTFWAIAFVTLLTAVITAKVVGPVAGLVSFLVGGIVAVAVADLMQTRQSIRRNFPVIGNLRYLFESIRPEINQYFIESNENGTPFNRETRSVVYQRAKREIDSVPFGARQDVYRSGHEWVCHSLVPSRLPESAMRVVIGGPDCRQPYDCSVFVVSAMSYGALSRSAILALNAGAREGGFAHNTGEGGVSPYHLAAGGDLVWQIGTGYFGCRTADGRFDPERFRSMAAAPSVKMIELKLSQGAKPGLGGILPAAKLTPEIAQIRGVPLGIDVHSPPSHAEFRTPRELLAFVARLRDLSDGKPVGIKLCLGSLEEFMALSKAMFDTGTTPDFITVDGAEGGTGAAPLEFANHVGMPLDEALVTVHNCLVGFGLRSRVTVVCSGRIVTGFDIVKRIAMGADVCASARGMMMALGCIQALRCHTNQCPTGIATQNPWLERGLVVPDKAARVANYHRATVAAARRIVEAMGVDGMRALTPGHILRRTGTGEARSLDRIYAFLAPRSFLSGQMSEPYATALAGASADSFHGALDTVAAGAGPFWTSRVAMVAGDAREQVRRHDPVPIAGHVVLTTQDHARILDLLSVARHDEVAPLLNQELARAILVAPSEVPPDVVTVNSEAEFIDEFSGQPMRLRLVYPRDADPDQGRESVLGPMGAALLGLSVGDSIAWPATVGPPRSVRLTGIGYQPEAAGDWDL